MKNNFTNQAIIFKTKDYEIFKKMECNRIIDLKHVNNIIRSMKKKVLMIPIVVNDKMEVIDGQHRLEALKKLNLEVTFIVCEDYGKEEMVQANISSKIWKELDYIRQYATNIEEYKNIRKNYVRIFEVMEKHNIQYGNFKTIFCKINSLTRTKFKADIETGIFSFSEANLVNVDNFMNCFQDILGYEKKFATKSSKNKQKILVGFLNLYAGDTANQYSHYQMTKKLQMHGENLSRDFPSWKEVLKTLCNEIYSYNEKSPKTTIRYDIASGKFYSK
ncbi:MAG: ParB N-terminal domain-containing protein [Cetobacterium sp.]